MVQLAASDPFSRVSRVAEILADNHFPGEPADHVEVARMLTRLLDHLDPGGDDVEVEIFLVAAYLDRFKMREAAHALLEAAELPTAPRDALMEMVRCQCLSPQIWQLVRAGVMGCAKSQHPKRPPGWRIDGQRIHAAVSPLYEMGETLAFQRLERAVGELAGCRDGDLEVQVKGADVRQGRRWVRTLREALTQERDRHGWRFAPHVHQV